MPIHSKSVYRDIASVVNPLYKKTINEADAPLRVGATKAASAEDVIHAITRALETGSDAVKKQARKETWMDSARAEGGVRATRYATPTDARFVKRACIVTFRIQ